MINVDDFNEKIKLWIIENKLVQIIAVFEKKDRKLFVGRLLKFDLKENMLLIYIDDTKKVEKIRMNEIDDISPLNFGTVI